METKEIIPAHPGFHKPEKRTYSFIDHDGKAKLSGSPARYSMASDVDGSVTLTEYANKREYQRHRDRVVNSITKQHRQDGRKRADCSCKFCGGRD